jgi:hypothetical protein
MTNTELATTNGTLAIRAPAPLADKLQYAERLAESDIVPRAYRGKPANILIAGELGERLGLSWAEALYRIDVIDGTPSLSAELIVSKVREAGHKLRLAYDPESKTAVCSIWRSDDPGFEYKAEWSWNRANSIADRDGKKLTDKANWRNYYPAMLRWRAESECANAACPEALWGMGRTAEELGAQELSDAEADDLGVMTRHQRVEHTALQRAAREHPGQWDRTIVVAAETPPEPETEPADPGKKPSNAAIGRLQRLLREIPLGTDEDVAALLHWLTGQPLDAELTAHGVKVVTSYLGDLLEATDDPEKAAGQAWAQYRAAHQEEAGDG